MIKFALAIAASSLSGCAAIAAKFENVPACSLTHDRAFVVSMYGPLGISSEVTERYAAAMCPQQFSPQPGLKPSR